LIYQTEKGILIHREGEFFLLSGDWDELINNEQLYSHLETITRDAEPLDNGQEILDRHLLPPLGLQEIWGAGVTYKKSREARKEESQDAGGGDFYQRVYEAERPEVFFKANPIRAAGSGDPVRIRRDASWSVPEPELTLVITSSGKVIGYTIGNDMSSRDIEGENPLYLPQAKTYDGSAAVGPGIWVSEQPPPPETEIRLDVSRGGTMAFRGEVAIGQMKRSFGELVEFLFRECSFPFGCLLMTGTGIVPPNDFSLQSGDEIRISIDPIGTLFNIVE